MISPSDLRAKWWDDALDDKGKALYFVMMSAGNQPPEVRDGWIDLPLTERHNWCCYAEQYESLALIYQRAPK